MCLKGGDGVVEENVEDSLFSINIEPNCGLPAHLNRMYVLAPGPHLSLLLPPFAGSHEQYCIDLELMAYCVVAYRQSCFAET